MMLIRMSCGCISEILMPIILWTSVRVVERLTVVRLVDVLWIPGLIGFYLSPGVLTSPVVHVVLLLLWRVRLVRRALLVDTGHLLVGRGPAVETVATVRRGCKIVDRVARRLAVCEAGLNTSTVQLNKSTWLTATGHRLTAGLRHWCDAGGQLTIVDALTVALSHAITYVVFVLLRH